MNSPSVFPTLSTGAVAQFPSTRVIESRTTVLRYVDGAEQRFPSMGRPIHRWIVRLTDVTVEELHALELFFHNRQGQFGSFSFTDPWTGVEYDDCSFESSEFRFESFAEGRAASTLIIRSNQV